MGAGRRLLAHPHDLAARLRRFNCDTVPPENVAALQKYMAHPEWPDPSELYAKAEDTPVLNALALGECNHQLCSASRRPGGPGATHRAAPCWPLRERRCCGTQKLPKMVASKRSTRWQDATIASWARLEDVRVYRESRKIGKRYLTVNVYRDCNRFFFSAYDPEDSVLRYVMVEQKGVNLLAPNSMEVRGGTFEEPPRSTLEMYQRLIRLCELDPPCQGPAHGHSAVLSVGASSYASCRNLVAFRVTLWCSQSRNVPVARCTLWRTYPSTLRGWSLRFPYQ